MDRDKIEEGDMVRVDCNNGMLTILMRAKVLNVARATGESWQFKGVNGLGEEQLVYINEGITITLLEKGYKEE